MLEVTTNEVNQMLSRVPYLEIVKCSCVEGANYAQITFVLRVSTAKKSQWYKLMQDLLRSSTEEWQPYIAQRYLIIDDDMRYRWELVLKVVDEDVFLENMRKILGSRTPEGAQTIQKIPIPWVPDGDRNVPNKETGGGVYKIGTMGEIGKLGLK